MCAKSQSVFISETDSRVCFLTTDWPFPFWELMSLTTALIWVEQVSYFPPACERCNILDDRLWFCDGRPDISDKGMVPKFTGVMNVVEGLKKKKKKEGAGLSYKLPVLFKKNHLWNRFN